MYDVIPLTPLRKVIAARMLEAKQTIPHFRVSVDIEVDKLVESRQEYNAAHPQQKISVNDLIIKACAASLMEYPAVNVQCVENDIHQYRQADISVVMAVDGGLSTPVIRQADQKSVQEIAVQVRDFAERAKAGRLKMDEILGGSFSISNLGMYNINQFDAIINPPQAAILAIGSAKVTPVVKTNEIRIATVLRATLSLDHRVIDGVTGAKFLATLKEKLQQPEKLL